MRTADGSVVDHTGKVIYFSTSRFVSDICMGDCCFLCGVSPRSTRFSDEHILPEWLLRRFGLFDKTITLPNGRAVRYDQYTVPCCESCNKLMGQEIEKPISAAVRGGPDALNKLVLEEGPLKLFVWLGLIYLKTHLRDRHHRFHVDHRKGDEKIADSYDWERLHHIHTVVRCFYVGSEIHPAVIGSFLVLPTRPIAEGDEFDFGDLYMAQTMLIRFGNIAIVTVFNDSCGAMNFFHSRAEKITGALSGLQVREVMVELAFLNLQLKERPTYHSDFDPVKGKRCYAALVG